jgi:hypothetical protein
MARGRKIQWEFVAPLSSLLALALFTAVFIH